MTAKQSILVQLKNDQREWGTILNDYKVKLLQQLVKENIENTIVLLKKNLN